jgi:E3 ubiquitin-protein ligase RBBP6
MTRLARSEEGGLVLPGGQTGTLIANEDAFAREILGLPTAAPQQHQGTAEAADGPQQQQRGPSEDSKPPLLMLDSKPAAEAGPGAAAPLVKAEPGAGPASLPTAMLGAEARAVAPPLLAGEAELSASAPFGVLPGAGFFSLFMQSALMPRGPPHFLRLAFDREEPLSRAGGCPHSLREHTAQRSRLPLPPQPARSLPPLAAPSWRSTPCSPPPADFERMQDDYRARYQLPPLRIPEPPRRRSPLRVQSPPRQRSPLRRRLPSRERFPLSQRRRSRSREGRPVLSQRDARERSKERSKERGRAGSKERSKERGRAGSKERSQERGRAGSKERGRAGSKDRRERSRERSRKPSKLGKEAERGKELDRDKAKVRFVRCACLPPPACSCWGDPGRG